MKRSNKKTRETQKACKELLMPLALLIIGLVLIVESAGAILIISEISVPAISSAIGIGCVYVLLKFIAGLVSFISGILILKK